MYGRISAAPSAQFSPTASGFACRTECQNAPTVCPDRIRPDASVTVPETITGRRSPLSSIRPDVTSGVSSKPVSLIGLGSPAFG